MTMPAPCLSDVATVQSDAAIVLSIAGATVAEMAPAEVTPRTPRREGRIEHWFAEDAKDSVEGTEAVLMMVIPLRLRALHAAFVARAAAAKVRPRRLHSLLERPPPKFVHDIVVEVSRETGFPPDFPADWPANRQEKIDMLQRISGNIASTLGMRNIDLDPVDVLRGKEVHRTRKLLQLLAIAAARVGAQLKALQLYARQDDGGLMTVACASMAGNTLAEFAAVDPKNPFSSLIELIYRQIPPPARVRWQIILPGAECPDESKRDVTLGNLFGLQAEAARSQEDVGVAIKPGRSIIGSRMKPHLNDEFGTVLERGWEPSPDR